MALLSQAQVPEPPPLKRRRGPLLVGGRDALLRNKGHKPVIKDTQEPACVLVLVQSCTSPAAWEQGNRFYTSVADGAPQTTTRRLLKSRFRLKFQWSQIMVLGSFQSLQAYRGSSDC